MTTTERVPASIAGRGLPSARRRRAWSWPHYLALVAIPIMFLNGWTVIAWLADGPHQVTEYRDRTALAWYAARVFEGAAIAISIVVLVCVVRGCRRQRRLLTFDVMFLLCGATLFWIDFGPNFFVPSYMMSSNFVNVNNLCGHMPFVVNPDCGRAPDPILLFVLLETFIPLGMAMALTPVLRKVRNRWPGLSTVKLIGLTILGGFVADLLLEPPAIAMGMWTYASPEWMSLELGQGLRLPVLEVIAGGSFFGLAVAVRLFKDDRGRTFIERGLDHHKPPARAAISLLALYAYLQLVLWIPGTMPLWFYGPYQGPWPEMPAHLSNGICDAPGVEGTRYGPCPGSPDFRMPGRHSLPGRSP